MTKKDITITKNPNGTFTASAIVNGYLEKMIFSGYTEKQAADKFYAHLIKMI